MRKISQRKITIYLPASMQRKLVSLAQKNKLKNLREGVKKTDKMPETMGAIVREALQEHFTKIGVAGMEKQDYLNSGVN